MSGLASASQPTTTHWLSKLMGSSRIRWFILFGTSGVCFLIIFGYFFQKKSKNKLKSLQTRPGSSLQVRSGVWRSIHFGSVVPNSPAVDLSSLTTEQLFENGVVSFQQGVNSWRVCCEMLDNQNIGSDTDIPEEESISSGAASSIPLSSPGRHLNRRRLRSLLLQSDLLSQLIDSVRYRQNAPALGEMRVYPDELQLLDGESMGQVSSPHISLPSRADTEGGSTAGVEYDSTDSFESATLLSDLETYSSRSGRKHPPSTPRIIIRTDDFYTEAMLLATRGEVYVRHMRTEMLHCENDADFTAKLHCVRLAFDFLIKSEENCSFFENQTRQLMTRFLTKANKDGEAFSREFTEIVNFVKNPANYPITEKELNSRKLRIVGFWDVAIDFALLDAFTDLENLPGPVTMVTQNRWLTPGLRESGLVNAVWAVMQGKVKMLENKDGFMSRFYRLGETFMLTLAWGFLGTDEVLKERCFVLKEGILSYLRDVFNLKTANYSNVATLSEDILRLGRDQLETLDSHF